ncbi:MAG TPA: hypothetical protein VHR64_12650 [Thermomicrobiales bacterium]|jgi:hypothetical protein|nr:hypothetical protein [Thermomicrobiales bacterium]
MHPSLHVRRRLAILAILALIFPIWSPPVVPVAAQDGLVTEKVLTDVIIQPPAPDGSLTVTRLILDSASRTQSMVFETSIVVVVETGEIKLWTRAGTTIDGIPVTSSPATVFVERSQTIIVPGGVRFRVRAWGCGPARLLFITLTG